MKKTWLLGATAMASAVFFSNTAMAQEFNSGDSDSSSDFVVTSTSGTTNAIAPEIQLQEQRHRNSILRPHLDAIVMRQHMAHGHTPEGYAGGFEGLAAGNGGSSITDKLSIWASVNYTDSENDFTATAYDSETRSGSVGVDYIATDKVSIGAFLSYSDTETDSTFNGGGSETDAITFGPYASVMINEIFSVDASIGYTSSDIDNTRLVGTTIATGSQDGDTVFGSVNVNAQKWYKNWGLSGRIGYSYSDTDNDAYTDSLGTSFASTDSQLGQLQVGAKVSYYTTKAMPYIGITYMNDVDSDDITTTTPPRPDNDDDEFQIDAGVSLFGEGPISGGISGNVSLGREDYDSWGIGGNISYKF